MSKKCTPLWAKREGFVLLHFQKTKRICKDAFSKAGAVQETSSSELLGGPAVLSWEGLHFGASDLQLCWDDFAWQVQHFVWPGITFSCRRNTLDRWSGKIAKRIGTRPSALHSTFHFWRKSRRIVSFLMLSTLKSEEVSQNSFEFDVVKIKNGGSLAELFRFWCRQVQKRRKSRRIASFSSLQIDR